MIGKKILITGSGGMLGSNLLTNLNCKNIYGIDSKVDIASINVVFKVLNEIKPNIIIHTAAYTDVEGCEINVDKAYKVNTLGTQNLVNYCVDKDVLFVYISSTGIYGASKENVYNEFDEVEPTTVHHKSKYEAEKIVQNHLNKYLILRTGWLYGGKKTHHKNFVYKRFLEAKTKDIIYSDSLQIGNPTYVLDFVNQIEILLNNNLYGIFNCVNQGNNISRYDYVKKIIDLFNIQSNVEIAPDGMFSRIAPVSNNESAVNYKLNLLDLNVMDNWEKSLKDYIQKLKSEQ